MVGLVGRKFDIFKKPLPFRLIFSSPSFFYEVVALQEECCTKNFEYIAVVVVGFFWQSKFEVRVGRLPELAQREREESAAGKWQMK